MPLFYNWFGLRAPLMWLLRRAMMLWVRVAVLPDDLPDEIEIDTARPVCYVLDLDGISNSLLLQEVCEKQGLPDCSGRLEGFDNEVSATIFMRRLRGFLVRRADPRISDDLVSILENFDRGEHGDVQFIPVSVFWGRAPQKEDSFFKLLFSDSWSMVGRLRKLMIILIHGRNTMVQFSQPVLLSALAESPQKPTLLARKLSRVIRVHFRRLRVAAIGPDLSHRRLLVNEIVASDVVQEAIENEAASNDISLEKAEKNARRYANEIAADYSHGTIRLLYGLLTKLWNSLYNGIVLNNFKIIKEVAPGNELIYVPCHRSHADYLLLSYVLYSQGLVPPHIAAGINLNLPVVGSILRRGGAFFLRRSFRGQKLYATVFDAYLRRNLSKGVSIEYFVEGTRSRTGKLLDAKAGMLSMTVKSYLKDHARPVVFVPIYFGYERLLEGRSYIKELSGAGKKKETVWGLIKSLRILRRNFGKVYVNFGDPIFLDSMLDQVSDDWREQDLENDKLDAITHQIIPDLGNDILTAINNSAAINPVNLLGLVLQTTEHQSMSEKYLTEQLDLYANMLRRIPYSRHVTIEESLSDGQAGIDVINYGLEFGLLERHPHELGDVIGLNPDNSGMLNYYRNNVKHLMAIPSLLACTFMADRSIAKDELIRFTASMYSLARGEYFMRWSMDEVTEYINDAIIELVSVGLINVQDNGERLSRPPRDTREIRQLDLLAQIFFSTVERYSLILNLLLDSPSGTHRRSELEQKSRTAAERVAMLDENAGPEYFDTRSHRRIVISLLASGFLWQDDGRRLCYDEKLKRIGELVHAVTDVPVRRVTLHN